MKRYTQPQIEKVELMSESIIATSVSANNSYGTGDKSAYSKGFVSEDWTDEDEE